MDKKIIKSQSIKNFEVIKLLKTFSRPELNRLALLINSPYHNRSEMPQILLKILIHFHPDFNNSKATQEEVYGELYPNEAFNYNKLQKAFSNLLALTKEFLIQEELKTNEKLKKRLLLQKLGQGNQYLSFKDKTKRQIQKIKKNSILESNHYLEIFLLYQTLYLHPNTPKLETKLAYLSEMLKALDSFYALVKLRHGCESKIKEKIYDRTPKIALLPELIDWVRLEKADSNLLFEMYLNIFNMLDNEQETNFSNTVSFFKKNLLKLPKQELKYLYRLLLNKAINEINAGNYEFAEFTLEMYLLGLRKKVLMANNKITDSTFTNIVVISCGIGQLDQAQALIDEYTEYLTAEFREIAVCLAQAYLYFHKKDFAQVIQIVHHDIFQKNSPATLTYKLRIWSLQIRSHYEIYNANANYYPYFFQNAKNIHKNYSRAKSLAQGRVEGYINLCRAIKKMAYIQQNNTAIVPKLSQLRKTVQSQKLTAKKWAIEKIDQLLI